MSSKTKALNEKLAHVARAKPITVQEDCGLGEGLALMRRHKIPCLLVCKGPKLSGVFTERDFLMKAAGKSCESEPIRNFMTAPPIIVSEESTVGGAVELMNSKGLRNLPLVDAAGAPVSLVTVSSLIRYLAEHFPAAVVNLPPQPQMAAEETDGA